MIGNGLVTHFFLNTMIDSPNPSAAGPMQSIHHDFGIGLHLNCNASHVALMLLLSHLENKCPK